MDKKIIIEHLIKETEGVCFSFDNDLVVFRIWSKMHSSFMNTELIAKFEVMGINSYLTYSITQNRIELNIML